MSVTDSRGKVSRTTYDLLNRPTSAVDPSNNVTGYVYDEASNLKQRTDARGLVTKYSYDPLDRLTKVEHWNGATLTDSVVYACDAVGRRTSLTDSTGATTYRYDALDRLESVTFPAAQTVEMGTTLPGTGRA